MQIDVGIIGGLVGFLVSYLGFMRNRDKDVKKDAATDAVISEKLNYIGSGVDSICVDIKVSERRITEISEQLI